MSGIRTSTGLFSGIDIGGITSQLIDLQRAPARRLETRIKTFGTVKSAVETLEANVIGLTAAITQLSSKTIFDSTRVTNSDPDQAFVAAKSSATLGSYSFKVLNLATTEQRLSRGFSNADKQKVGTGTIAISTGGKLDTATRLSNLNGGAGVQRGSIRVTDRSGKTASIDLSKAYSVEDVLAAINDQGDVAVTASAAGGHIELTDVSGSSTSNLIVQDIGTGKTALDLGIRKSVSSTSLSGDEVYYVTGDFTFDQLNDGNHIANVAEVDDLKITLSDSTQLDLNFDSIFNLNELVTAINDHTSNAGKLTAALTNGRLVLTDNAAGAGTLAVQNLNGAEVVSALGLDNAAAGNVITGDKLLAGLNSKLIRNLRGGRGITTLGEVALTDRTGRTATIDLSSASSLDEVISAINSATDGGSELSLTARINSLRTGIEVVDTSGSTASNLIIADVGGGSVATDLGIAVNAASTSINSGALGLRRVNHNTLLEHYAPDGGSIDKGSFLIVDSAGNQESISITSSVKTIGDVLTRINAAAGIQVRAELNETGDGIAVIDEAGGAGTLQIREVTGTSAADLRILGTGSVGSSGAQQISGRQRTEIAVTSTDTLKTVADKITAATKNLAAGVIRDGAAFNSYRLQLTSKATGSDGQYVVDSGSLDLGFAVTTEASEALLQVGTSTASSYLIASSDNQFDDVATGVNVTAKSVGTTTSQVSIARNTETVKQTLNSLVQAYNNYVDKATDLSKSNVDPKLRGPLQGQGIVDNVRSRLTSILTKTYFGKGSPVQTLNDLGLRITSGGKLNFDQDKYDKLATDNPGAIRSFFHDELNGAGKKIDAAFDAITDTISGVFVTQKKSLETNIKSLQARVEQIDARLVIRQEILLRKFVKMESIIGSTQSQQNALNAITGR